VGTRLAQSALHGAGVGDSRGIVVRITAGDIKRWADTAGARGDLPLFLRRLVMRAGTITEIAIPAGDSVTRPGWDGWVVSKEGDAWVPAGRSCWECSVEKSATGKANRDYNGRTGDTPEEVRRDTVYCELTARHWQNKVAWAADKRAENKWRDVRAYDADDLELWLEYYPAVALAFAEHIGLSGGGVETLSRYWQDWASQSNPPITAQPFFADRTDAKAKLVADLRERIGRKDTGVYALRADSAAEAIAFVCAVLLDDAPELADLALVVTDEAGWRFVETNVNLRLAIAARPEIAQRATANVLAIVPVAAGDLASGFAGSRGDGFQLELSRPSIYAFRDALIEIGVEEADARRIAASTGRSWSVFRRRLASNPCLRRPAWLGMPEADALATVCLLGSWHGGKEADRAIVAKLAGAPYETVERKLRELAQVDDAPILAIGKVWRAKAPLELLDLYAERITSDQLDRFFEMVEALLVKPDPRLELEPDKRWMADVYGKVRDESGRVFESVCDSLVKLAVRGPAYAGLAARVASLVERLLGEADATRWLSLASHLRPLAEAAPEAFLRAIDTSLAQPEPPLARLFEDGVASEHPLTGGNWQYAGLLWALEILAWSPRGMSRVAPILARLSHYPLPDNWGNRPANSLLDIFRSWCPQTAANLDQRLAVLDKLIAVEPDIAFKLMDRLLPRGMDTASPSAKPVWRDDDAGAVDRPKSEEIYRQNGAVADRMLAMADGNATRLVRLLDKLDLLDPERADKVASMVGAFLTPTAPDSDRERLRNAVRKMLHWRLNYGKSNAETALQPEQRILWLSLYDGLAPEDLVTRNRWLFEKEWVDLPLARDEDFSMQERCRDAWRLEALSEVYRDGGLDGVARLADASADAFLVGRSLLRIVQDQDALTDWIVTFDTDFSVGTPASMICGILRWLPEDVTLPFLQRLVATVQAKAWEPGRIAALLRLARDEPTTWDLVEGCGDAVASAYWRIVVPTLWGATKAARERAVGNLLTAARPIVALNVASQGRGDIGPALILDVMEAALGSMETEVSLPHSWHLAELFERLEACDEVDVERLIRVQFGFVPAFRMEQTAALNKLTEAITSRPELLTELVCLVYKSEIADADDNECATEAEARAAEHAEDVLDDCKRQPGTRADGWIDADTCRQFVDDTLALCEVKGRLKMAQYTIGKILAHAPEGDDGVWPGSPARDILNRPDVDEMRIGFEVGTRNGRGVSVRSPTAGGIQERALAARFRRYADALSVTHPFLSASLEEIARSYDADARREDDRAALTRERY
jgi:hypothetical protein